MFEATIAGSLPKPGWLAETDKLWPQWKLAGEELAAAKRDATLLWLKAQEDAGIDLVTDGEQSRQHFVHGFLEAVEGIDFALKVDAPSRSADGIIADNASPSEQKYIPAIHLASARVSGPNSGSASTRRR